MRLRWPNLRLTRRRSKVKPIFRYHPKKLELPLLGIFWATFDQDNIEDFSAYSSSTALKGHGWDKWERAIKGRIGLARYAAEVVETSTTVRLTGESVLDVASMFDIAVFGHHLPQVAVEAIQARSTAPNGTRVYFWALGFESIGQNVQWNYLRKDTSEALSIDGNYPLLVAATNAYGDYCIDKFESAGGQGACAHSVKHAGLPDWGDAPHTWDLDIPRLTQDLDFAIDVHLTPLTANRPTDPWWTDTTKLSGWFWDNLQTWPFKGSATNDYPAGWTDDYRAAWQAFLGHWDTYRAPLHGSTLEHRWVNGTMAVTTYTKAHVRNRFVEHFFRSGSSAKTAAQIQADLEGIRDNDIHVCISIIGTIGQTHLWATTTGGSGGTWAEIIDLARTYGITRQLYVAAWIQISGAYAYHQTGFREPE
jgi:hypothetical protein